VLFSMFPTTRSQRHVPSQSDCTPMTGQSPTPEDIVARIVADNLASGRAQRVIGRIAQIPRSGNAPARVTSDGDEPALDPQLLAEYTERVAQIYQQDSERVEALARGDETEWGILRDQLLRYAEKMLRRLGVPYDRVQPDAEDFVQHTCTIIYTQRFPFDVAFDVWATSILSHVIWRTRKRSLDLVDRTFVLSLDYTSRDAKGGELSLHSTVEDPDSLEAFASLETQEWLLDAIIHLKSDAQRAVIIHRFFFDRSMDEIASMLGKSRNAVYQLQHRALRELKEYLES